MSSSACLCCALASLALQLLKHLDQLIKEEAERGWKPPEGQEDSRVLGSANALFLKIRASLQRCVKLVSRGSTLVRLAGAFKVRAVVFLAPRALPSSTAQKPQTWLAAAQTPAGVSASKVQWMAANLEV